jgi:flagellar biosynthesis anti-sigma factor FlgM
MKIGDRGPTDLRVVPPERDGAPPAAPPKEKKVEVGVAARVEISPAARRLQAVSALIAEADRARAERVREIKERLERGEYRIEAGAVAAAMARSEIVWLLGT